MDNYICKIEGKNKHSGTYGGEIFKSDFIGIGNFPTDEKTERIRSPIAGRVMADYRVERMLYNGTKRNLIYRTTAMT